MTKETMLFPTAPGSTDMAIPNDLADSMIQAGNAADAGSVNYLKFTKQGAWVFGRDDDEVDKDEILAVNPMSFTVGWQGWKEGKPVDGPSLPIHQAADLPMESELEKIPAGDMNGRSKQLGVSVKSMDDGTVLQFNSTSRGGKQAITKLMREIGLGMKAHPNEPVALIKLSSDSYKHKTYGNINTPILNIVGWADGAGKENKKLVAA